MAKYRIHMFCNECSDVHPFPIAINLDNGPIKEERVGDVYDGEEVPESIIAMTNNSIRCPNTGKMTTQKDNNQLVLVPV